MTLNSAYRSFLNSAKSCILSCLSKVDNVKIFTQYSAVSLVQRLVLKQRYKETQNGLWLTLTKLLRNIVLRFQSVKIYLAGFDLFKVIVMGSASFKCLLLQ